MIEKPKKKGRTQLDDAIFIKRQRKGVELMRSEDAHVVTKKSSEILELKEIVEKMDARIKAQAKIIRVQSARIDEQDDIIKDMHTLITYQGNQIDSIFEALSCISKDRRDINKDADDDDNAVDANKTHNIDKDVGVKDAGGESTCI